MSAFTPCKGKTVCRDDGATCLTCGRSFAEQVEKKLRHRLEALPEPSPGA